MLKLFLSLTVLIIPAQSDSSAFYIERTEVNSEYGSIYILRLANQIIPPDKLSRKSDIDCLIKEAKESGIFSDVHTELIQEGEGNTRKLIVTATPDPQLMGITISEFTLVGFPEVDKLRFQLALDKYDVSIGKPLAKYSLNVLMQRINKALREAFQHRLDENDMENPWIAIRPAGTGKVKLIVSPTYMGCEATREQ